MNTRDQYMLEKQQRYLKFIQQYSEPEPPMQQKVLMEQSDREKERKKVSRKARYMEQPSLTMDRYIPSRFRIYNIILDSTFRDLAAYPNANDFVVKLVEPLRNVVAIRLLRTEFYQPSNTTGYFVLNEVRIPLQVYNNIANAYLYLNGYTSTNVANDTSTTFFGRIGPGTEIYPAITGDPTLDPYIYIMQPIEPKLRRFHVKLMNADRSDYAVTNARVIITLAVYCLQ